MQFVLFAIEKIPERDIQVGADGLPLGALHLIPPDRPVSSPTRSKERIRTVSSGGTKDEKEEEEEEDGEEVKEEEDLKKDKASWLSDE
ncbi:unnamed protein product [Protopolystoma xenopodis]|uniref:Uncharacterized protein n=1 Tax=Protopolystoma xenopodis TaxID=117903 RepID=A0A448XKV3_9PLAT|nr:unnamed protein product [Protopolystoma xenopodis]